MANVFTSSEGDRTYNGGKISCKPEDIKKCNEWYKSLKRLSTEYINSKK